MVEQENGIISAPTYGCVFKLVWKEMQSDTIITESKEQEFLARLIDTYELYQRGKTDLASFLKARAEAKAGGQK